MTNQVTYQSFGIDGGLVASEGDDAKLHTSEIETKGWAQLMGSREQSLMSTIGGSSAGIWLRSPLPAYAKKLSNARARLT